MCNLTAVLNYFINKLNEDNTSNNISNIPKYSNQLISNLV